MQTELHFHVRLEDDCFWATVDEMPGVFAAGNTMEELIASLEEGLALVLTDPVRGQPTVSIENWQDIGEEAQPNESTASAELCFA